jgi:hypothetical protein
MDIIMLTRGKTLRKFFPDSGNPVFPDINTRVHPSLAKGENLKKRV